MLPINRFDVHKPGTVLLLFCCCCSTSITKNGLHSTWIEGDSKIKWTQRKKSGRLNKSDCLLVQGQTHRNVIPLNYIQRNSNVNSAAFFAPIYRMNHSFVINGLFTIKPFVCAFFIVQMHLLLFYSSFSLWLAQRCDCKE